MSQELPTSNQFGKLSTEAQLEKKLMQDVLILLSSMFEREESTVKLILNCLYDVGATNLINQKFRYGTLNKTLKWISKRSKPAFRLVAWQWFRKNCPQLITDWLYGQIEFKPVSPKPTPSSRVEVITNTNKSLLPMTEDQMYEVKYEVRQLRSQVKLLRGILVGLATLLTASFMWAVYTIDH
ncbi:hypothetical protein B7O87_06025 [Cylindrospermopsis raciborskii CENA303]|uniref:Uncharacterized protein n=1 Tax=Cylindrospermopsis raciborskii CENA303 TaxID=1170769 RepID=A0A1X4G8Q8_9CYAN|nr:hypothetical protein [Cylindrospermopsis raciborskii]OSO93014.1 hypothetical protein B7O87_06025 [Cylindrospermopsis raciborskii CENA303]